MQFFYLIIFNLVVNLVNAQVTQKVEYRRDGNRIIMNDGRVFRIDGDVIRDGNGNTFRLDGNTIRSSDGTTTRISGKHTYSSDGTFCTWNGNRQTCWDNKDTRPSENGMTSQADCLKIRKFYDQKIQQDAVRMGGSAQSGARAQYEIQKNQEYSRCMIIVEQAKEQARLQRESAVNQAPSTALDQSNPQPQQPVSESKKDLCLRETQKMECIDKIPKFQCFQFQNESVAVIVDDKSNCFVTTCDCFNFYKGI